MNPQDSQIHFWAVLVRHGLIVGSLAHGGRRTGAWRGAQHRRADDAAPGRDGDRAARRRRARSRCCSSSATRRSASWAAPGCSPAARSTREARATPHRAAGVREVAEEAGVDAARPGGARARSRAGSRRAEVKIRFDTHFFLAAAPDGRRAAASTAARCVDARLVRAARARWRPTSAARSCSCSRRSRRSSSSPPFGSADELLAWARGREVEPDRAARGDGGRGRARRPAGRAGLRGMSAPRPAWSTRAARRRGRCRAPLELAANFRT